MKSFLEYIAEAKSVFDYLLFEPKGEELKHATKISKMISDPRCVYRGMSMKEYKALVRDKIITSEGQGNTRGGDSPYVTEDIQLAGRFAIRAWKDNKAGAALVTFDRAALPDLRPADPTNFRVDFISAIAMKDKYLLRN
jgi:hypothetical protein